MGTITGPLDTGGAILLLLTVTFSKLLSTDASFLCFDKQFAVMNAYGEGL
jgi:hypothetical protein